MTHYSFNKRKKDNPLSTFFTMVLVCGMVAFGITMIAATTNKKQEPKKYPVSLDINSWGVILDCLDKSTAPHTTITSATKAILDQIQPPYQADMRKQDSLNKIKPKQ